MKDLVAGVTKQTNRMTVSIRCRCTGRELVDKTQLINPSCAAAIDDGLA